MKQEGGGPAMDPCAFNAMMEQYEKLVYTVCLRLVHDEHLAQDLTQETFLSAWVHRSACPDGAQKAWLCRIAANKAKDHLKSAWARRTQLTDFAAESAAPAGTESLAAQAELRLASRAAQEQICALPEPYHTVSVLYFLQGCPVDDIARALGRMPKTVHTQLYRAKLRLRAQLAAC